MQLDGEQIRIANPNEALYAATLVAQVTSDKVLHNNPGIIDMFVAGEAGQNSPFPMELTPSESKLVFTALRGEMDIEGEDPDSATRRLRAAACLSGMGLLGVRRWRDVKGSANNLSNSRD